MNTGEEAGILCGDFSVESLLMRSLRRLVLGMLMLLCGCCGLVGLEVGCAYDERCATSNGMHGFYYKDICIPMMVYL